jgi:hypothetical protein
LPYPIHYHGLHVRAREYNKGSLVTIVVARASMMLHTTLMNTTNHAEYVNAAAEDCRGCNGHGRLTSEHDPYVYSSTCESCGGSGLVVRCVLCGDTDPGVALDGAHPDCRAETERLDRAEHEHEHRAGAL